jgi:hypothetical protein
MSKLSKAAVATAAILIGAALGGCAQTPSSSDAAANAAPAATQNAPATSDGAGVNAYSPDQITGVNGSGNPGATGPGGAHDSASGSGWNAGPRSNVGGAHND